MEPGGWDAAYDSVLRAFLAHGESAEEAEFWRGVAEPSRYVVVRDEDEVVGTAGSFPFRMTVPGGAEVPLAGVTMVTVQSTHRRRGVLTAMMRKQLDDLYAAGEALAGLTASEPPIYGRFGYGLATEQASVSVDSRLVRIDAPPAAARVRLRVRDPRSVAEQCERLYARLVPERPGMLARQPGWEEVELLDPPEDRAGFGPRQCLVAEVDGEFAGYARFAVKPHWESGGPDGSVMVNKVLAVDPAASAAMWRYLLSIDLTSKLVGRNLPTDDPLLHLVSDVRRCRIGLRDMLFLRLVDVGAALASRTYAVPVDVVFEVSDPFCPWNEGRWRLAGDAKGATCQRTTGRADLALSARELGSVYLGGTSLVALGAAGRVEELRGGALAEASLAFRGQVAPWLPHGF